MRFTTSLSLSALSLSLLSTTSAIITGITAPSIIAPGQPFTITINTANYVQSVYDVAVAFGIAPGAGFHGSLGSVFASEYLGPSLSNIETPIDFTILIDENTPVGPVLLSATTLSLFGAVAEPVASLWNVTVTVGEVTSQDTVTSKSQ